MPDVGNLQREQPVSYRICLRGTLDPSWSAMLGGMTIAYSQPEDGDNVTILDGWLIDQAALMGVLNLVYDLGLRVLLVEQNEPSPGVESP